MFAGGGKGGVISCLGGLSNLKGKRSEEVLILARVDAEVVTTFNYLFRGRPQDGVFFSQNWGPAREEKKPEEELINRIAAPEPQRPNHSV